MYFNHDTGKMEPKIPGTAENWENGSLGQDARYAKAAPMTPELKRAARAQPLSEDDPRLIFMPERDVSAASGICQAYRDRWFIVHPSRGLVFFQSSKRRQGELRGASPQCNDNIEIVKSIASRLYPWAEVRQYPLVLAPVNVNDY